MEAEVEEGKWQWQMEGERMIWVMRKKEVEEED